MKPIRATLFELLEVSYSLENHSFRSLQNLSRKNKFIQTHINLVEMKNDVQLEYMNVSIRRKEDKGEKRKLPRTHY